MGFISTPSHRIALYNLPKWIFTEISAKIQLHYKKLNPIEARLKSHVVKNNSINIYKAIIL